MVIRRFNTVPCGKGNISSGRGFLFLPPDYNGLSMGFDAVAKSWWCIYALEGRNWRGQGGSWCMSREECNDIDGYHERCVLKSARLA